MITLDFTQSNAEALLKEHNIALKLEEARTLQKSAGRPLTLMEATILGIQLSEHCSYKSSRPFLKRLPTDGPTVILGPKEDAGVLEVFEYKGEKYGIAVGHESHNHPSQIVPYEGAATGIGGIIRDIICMGARPVAVGDSLRFGDPAKPLQRTIAQGVTQGIAGYGNPLGVPNLGGDAFFDKEFNDNCLVNAIAFGVLRESDLIHSYVPPQAAKEAWKLILVGKPTDNSGFGGASFASDSFEAEDDIERKKAAVQEPNPFLERHLIVSIFDLLEKLKVMGRYQDIACKDLGAGGVLCATVELVEGAGFGADVELDKLHTAGNYPPHVIACSETQERFCFACKPDLADFIVDHFQNTWELGKVAAHAGASVVGTVTPGGQYKVTYNSEMYCDLPASMITEGIIYNRAYESTPKKEVHTEVKFEKGEMIFSS